MLVVSLEVNTPEEFATNDELTVIEFAMIGEPVLTQYVLIPAINTDMSTDCRAALANDGLVRVKNLSPPEAVLTEAVCGSCDDLT